MYIYMDNLKVHSTDMVKDVYEELEITPIYGPYYSPDYNAIEFVFSSLKQKVKKMRLQDMVAKRQRPFTQLIPKAIAEVTV